MAVAQRLAPNNAQFNTPTVVTISSGGVIVADFQQSSGPGLPGLVCGAVAPADLQLFTFVPADPSIAVNF